MIIIPDIHGRTFWKEALEKRNENEKVIFLGDYLDPYPREHIKARDAIDNFKEIIEFLKRDDNVSALLGNHDFMTYISREMGECRTDTWNAPEIRKLFMENLDLFKIAEIDKVGEDMYVFSHAPILKEWVENNNHIFNPTDKLPKIVEKLNTLLGEKKLDPLCNALDNISYFRGGWNETGSCVWADVRELSHRPSYDWPGYHSIFGHTQLKDPLLESNYSCLDSRRAFRLDDDGEIKEITEDCCPL